MLPDRATPSPIYLNPTEIVGLINPILFVRMLSTAILRRGVDQPEFCFSRMEMTISESQTDTTSGSDARGWLLPELDLVWQMADGATRQPALEALLDWVEATR